MTRFQWACCLSLGIHVAALAGGDLLVFHGPQAAVSRGQTRVAVVFRSEPKVQIKEPVQERLEATLTTEVESPDRRSNQPAQMVPLAPLEEGVEEIPPAYLRNLPPIYPREAFLKNIQGTVWILAEIDRQGRPSRVEVERPSGSHLLDAAAVEAVATWQFIPARRAGRAVASRVRIPISFQIVIGQPELKEDKP